MLPVKSMLLQLFSQLLKLLRRLRLVKQHTNTQKSEYMRKSERCYLTVSHNVQHVLRSQRPNKNVQHPCEPFKVRPNVGLSQISWKTALQFQACSTAVSRYEPVTSRIFTL